MIVTAEKCWNSVKENLTDHALNLSWFNVKYTGPFGSAPGTVPERLKEMDYLFGIFRDRYLPAYKAALKKCEERHDKTSLVVPDPGSVPERIIFTAWLVAEADRALAYDVGELVKIKRTGEYGIVKGYEPRFVEQSSMSGITDIRFPYLLVLFAGRGTAQRVSTDDVEPADVPDGIMKLAMTELGTGVCPFLKRQTEKQTEE